MRTIVGRSKGNPVAARQFPPAAFMEQFAGLSIPEAADALGVSTATVEREWAMAKAWLHREMETDS